MSKVKKWIVNIVILIIATILMLAVAEVGMRWWDGYRLSTLELNQNVNQTQQER